MQGSLAEHNPLDLLRQIRQRQASGILHLHAGQAARQLFIDGGMVIRFATSNVPQESITQLFRERRVVSEEQLRHAAGAKQADELLGTALRRLGFVSPEVLAGLAREHILRVVAAALEMRDGTYDFQTGALPFREQIDVGVPAAEVLLGWARTCTDLDWIRHRIGPPESRVEMAVRPPEGYQSVSLSPVEGFIMSRVDGRATIQEICIVSPMGEEAAQRALCGLMLAGLIHIPDAPATGPVLSTSQAGGASASAVPRSSATFRPPTAPGAPSRPPITPAGSPRPATSPGGAPRPHGAAAPAAGTARSAPGKPGGPPLRRPGVARPAPPRVVKPVAAARRVATVDLENEMLRRFDQMSQQNLYEVLGVSNGSAVDDVRRAYYGLAKTFHPDKFIRDEIKSKAEKVFAHITEAYSTLSKQETRAKYDEDLASRRPKELDKTMDGPGLARLNFRHGRDQFEKGRPGESVAFFQNACDQDPSKSEYFYWLGVAQSRNPRWKKDAEENFLRAIQIDPTNGEYYAHLGSLYARGGVQTKAREMFRKALQWDAENTMAHEGLAAIEEGKKGLLGMLKAK